MYNALGIEVLGRAIHTTSQGMRLLVLPGDEFDEVIKHGALAAIAGSVAYRSLLCLSLKAAAAAGVDSIVCGHIHKADLLTRDGLAYCNDGDWVESCTALVEQSSGELALVTWRPRVSVAAIAQPLRDAA